MAEKIQAFFKEAEEVWAAFPGYFKVFLYAITSAVVGLYFDRNLTLDSVIGIVVTNLGLYTIPRAVNTQVQKLK